MGTNLASNELNSGAITRETPVRFCSIYEGSSRSRRSINFSSDFNGPRIVEGEITKKATILVHTTSLKEGVMNFFIRVIKRWKSPTRKLKTQQQL